MFKKLFVANKVNIFFIAFLLINLLVGVVILAKIDISLNQRITVIEEEQRPADLDITIIKNSACVECFNFTKVIDLVKKYNVNIVSEEVVEYNSDLGQKLIANNNIKSVPAFVVKGEIDKNAEVQKILSQFGVVDGDNFVATKVPAPYFSLGSKEIVGKTNLIMLSDDTCSECYDVETHRTIMKNFGVYVEQEELLSIQTARGRQLMNQYKINLLPTIILSGDVEAYNVITSIWDQVGTVEEDKSFVFREGVKTMGVYKDLIANKIIDPRAKANELK